MEGAALEEAERIAKELKDWRSKVIVDDECFFATFPVRNVPSQIDKHKNLLEGDPKKLAFVRTHVPQHPISMFLAEPATDDDPATAFVRQTRPELWTERGTDFKSVLPKTKCQLYAPGLTQSWWGSLHDPHLQD